MDMCSTCLYADNMLKMIQVRNVPEDVHRTLKARAAREGMSLSDFLKKELARAAERPTMQEWLDRTQQVRPIRGKRSPSQVIRDLRDSR
jgi:plasmid stability protein